MAKMKKVNKQIFQGCSGRTLNENKWLVLAFKTQFEVSMQKQKNGLLEKTKKNIQKIVSWSRYLTFNFLRQARPRQHRQA